jgi:hypothetical protein
MRCESVLKSRPEKSIPVNREAFSCLVVRAARCISLLRCLLQGRDRVEFTPFWQLMWQQDTAKLMIFKAHHYRHQDLAPAERQKPVAQSHLRRQIPRRYRSQRTHIIERHLKTSITQIPPWLLCGHAPTQTTGLTMALLQFPHGPLEQTFRATVSKNLDQ